MRILLLELPQLRRGLEAELLDQVAARLLVRAEGLRLTARAVEREHVLSTEALAERVLLAQHLQLGDEFGVSPHRELGFDPRLDGGEPQLLQTPRLELERERFAHVGVRVPRHSASAALSR